MYTYRLFMRQKLVHGSDHINVIHSKFRNVRKSKNLRSYHSNQVSWECSVNKDASFIQTSGILKLTIATKSRHSA